MEFEIRFLVPTKQKTDIKSILKEISLVDSCDLNSLTKEDLTSYSSGPGEKF